MKSIKYLIFFVLLAPNSISQNISIDTIYDIITEANRSYLDENKSINYLKPLEILKYNLKDFERIDDIYISDYMGFLNVAKSYLHIKDSTNIYKDMIALPERVKLFDAMPFLRKGIRSSRIVMINEAHDIPEHRLFAESLLKMLYKKGFRYLAIESLYWDDIDINERGYPLTITGYYTREPYFSNFIRSAIQNGFTVIPYEQKVGSGDINQREENQANNLIDFLIEHPSSKLIVYAGYAHIQERSKVDDIKWMAQRIKDSLKLDPFTIDQTSFIKSKDNKKGKPFLLNLNKINIQDSILHDFHEVFDVSIINYLEHEKLHLNIGKKRYLISVKEEYFAQNKHLLLQAYLASEYKAFKEMAIPFDQKLLLNNLETVKFYLKPKEKYILIIRDSDNNILIKKEFKKRKKLLINL